MSARAAARLETLGFAQVYRYSAGKTDWTAAGLPSEGDLASVPRVVSAMRRDVPTCRVSETIGAVRARIEEAGWDRCVIVDDKRVVLGLVSGDALRAADDTPSEDVMDPAPLTFRPDTVLEELVHYMHEHD